MASFTEKYNLGYFDLYEDLGTNYSVQLEVDRWTLLDKLLYGLMSIVGNGIIEGWELSVDLDDKLTLQISEGKGNINYFAGETTFPSTLELETNSFYYIYAIRSDVITDTDVYFIQSKIEIANEEHLFLGTVRTGISGIEEIDMSGRTEVDLIEQIKDEIKQHKHRGGTNHPSKIDLQTDVKGQLPSFRIKDFDASKITTGTVDLVRMPLLSHNLLQNIGQLTHSQIEAFIKTLEVNNKELFGEVATSNLLQQHILMKYLFDDPESQFYYSDGPSDKYYNNEFTVIPGISPDSFLDVENTTAIIDKELHEIRGIPPVRGSTFFINYDTDLAWQGAYSLENLAIANNEVFLSKGTDEVDQLVIENFESSTGNNQLLSDGTNFKKEIITLNANDAKMASESNPLNVVEGAFSAKITSEQAFRLQYVKEFSSAQDWSLYDSFLIDVKSEKIPHGAVKLYFVSSSGKESPHYVLLEEDELTSNDENKGFETRIISIPSLDFSNDIKKMIIYTDDLTNPFAFYVDSIVVQRAVLMPESGKMIIRYSTSAPVTFNFIDWNIEEPSGTSIQIRARSANGGVLLNRAEYTGWLVSGQTLNLMGTDVEIEINFFSDEDRITSPKLKKVRISIISDAESEGFTIDEEAEFARGTNTNTKITSSGSTAYVSLKTPIYVGSHYFTVGKNIQQIYYDQTDSNNPFNRSEVAIFGINTPIAPNTVIERIEKYGPSITVQSASFLDPKSSIRLQNRNFLVADTFNDRILEMNEEGELVNGFGSISYTFEKLFPIAACVDERTGILYLVWSKSVPFKSVRVSKITLKTTTTTIPLRDNFDKPYGYTTTELETLNIEGQIMPIYLMDQNFALVQNTTSALYLSVDNDIIEGGIDSNSEYYRAIKTIGIPCFVGNFAYISGISSPTYANTTINNGYIIGNARIASKTFKVHEDIEEETLTKNEGFSDIIEIDENGGTIWGSPNNWVNFSPFFPGRAQQIDKDTLLIAGLKTSSTQYVNPEDLDFMSISGDSATVQKQKEILITAMKDRVGAAGVIYNYKTTDWSYAVGPYYSAENVFISDADINNSGYMVVAESSLERSGRIVTIDNFGVINNSYGEGLYALISDISVNNDDTMTITA